MKRDARIGLAVVLVLGLAVTLLVGRALYKRGPVPPTESEEVAGDAPASTDPHRDAADSGPAAAAAANPAPAPGIPIAGGAGQTGSRQPEATTVHQFLENNHTTGAAQPADAAPHGAPAPGVHNQTAGDHTTPPPPPNNGGATVPGAGAGWEDHEGTTATPAASEAPSGGYGYTVKSGDNMWKISSSVYGDGKYTQKIVEANPGMNTQKLKPGTVIHIPAIPHKTVLMRLPSFADARLGGAAIAQQQPAEEHTATPVAATTHAAAPESEVPAGGTTHKVESGETLGAIAKKYYGSGGPKSVALIVNANKGLEPTKLKVGQELVIPAKK